MKMYGIPASIILAQGILESGAERDLANRANNHFGIKMPMTGQAKVLDMTMMLVRNALESIVIPQIF
jgi:flagellum-specific peptidoglycan hydrolase FlgJ